MALLDNLKKNLNPIIRGRESIANGSQTFEHSCGGIAASASETQRVGKDIWNGRGQDARRYLPLDEITIINNSAENVKIILNSPSEFRTVPAYTIKGIANQPFVQFTIENVGTGAIAAGEVVVQAKKIGSKVTFVKSV